MTAAVILAVTPDDRVLLVEQHRVPLGGACLELPAGLVGDHGPEEVTAAAIRELEEETGWRAARMISLGDFVSSPGLTSERFWLLRAEALARVGPGGGVDDEQITVHAVPRRNIAAFIDACRARGLSIDVKLLCLLPALDNEPIVCSTS